MSRAGLARIGKLAAWIAAPFAGLVLVAIAVAWSGLVNIAASRGHWAVVEQFLAFGMRRSVEVRALAIDVPPLGDPDLVTLGAGHFHGGCAFCHGAPGVPVSPVAERMLPPPPNLSRSMRPWSDAELFWIVKHGIKYTGMPGWVALERGDEIWAVAAFLRVMPNIEPARYRQLALGSVRIAGQTGKELATVDSDQQAAGACGRCHGAEGVGPASALVPMLHGQPAAFIVRALQEYAAGVRRSGFMQPMAAGLDAQEMRRLAEYYAQLTPPRSAPSATDASLIARGRRIAAEGDAAKGVPACNLCHARDALAEYPRLAGQSARYMIGQLALWRSGHHGSTGSGMIMAPIAQRLSEADIEAVTAYFASLPAGRDSGGRQ
jgi:cytochrome c553